MMPSAACNRHGTGRPLRCSCCAAPRHWFPGIGFSARTLLEVAVALLGSFVGAQTMMAIGTGMLAGIAAVVVIVLGASYAIGRLLGLPARMATLVACGNAIC